MRLTTAGYLGIGTSNPAGRLHVVTDNDDTGNDYYFMIMVPLQHRDSFEKGRGTIAAPQNLQAGDNISQFLFAPRHNGSVSFTDGSGMDAWYQGTGINNISDLRLYTTGTEVMHLGENGSIGVNTLAFDATILKKVLIDAGNTSSYT